MSEVCQGGGFNSQQQHVLLSTPQRAAVCRSVLICFFKVWNWSNSQNVQRTAIFDWYVFIYLQYWYLMFIINYLKHLFEFGHVLNTFIWIWKCLGKSRNNIIKTYRITVSLWSKIGLNHCVSTNYFMLQSYTVWMGSTFK